MHSPDEKARIIAHGGRVFEWGVPRVWLRDVDMPGLAMARSFGDMAAETVGVFAEPELSKVTLTSNHRFVIWASDGTRWARSVLVMAVVRAADRPCASYRCVGVHFIPRCVQHRVQTLEAGPAQGG